MRYESNLPLGQLVALPSESLAVLGDTSCDVVREPAQGGVRYTATINAPLGRRALMDVLYALAPYKAHGPDRFGRVLDNWGIFDRAMSGGGAATSNLFMQHVKGLGDNWRVFGEHRHVFVSMFSDTTESYRVVPFVTWETSAEGKRRFVLDEVEPVGPDHPDALVGLVTLVYLQPGLASRWPAWRPLQKDGKSNYIGPASVPMMALMHRRAILSNSKFIHAVEALDLD